MFDTRFVICCMVAACFAVAFAAAEKQIKLEDIEKDTLKAAQQAKLEKQIQEQQQQHLGQQYHSQQSSTYQNPTSYIQYVVPQQYLSQAHSQYIPLSEYTALASNNLGVGYGSPSSHAYQAYMSPLLASAVSGYHLSQGHSGQQVQAQTQPVIMAIPLAALQQQHYSSALQYYPSQTGQSAHFYYAPQVVDQSSSSHYPTASAYASAQQYLPPYQPVKGSTAYTQFVSTAPQAFPSQSYTSGRLASYFTPQTYSTNLVYSKTETPTFVTVKAPQHLVASAGQKLQFAQAQTTTLSPLQTKYLNSPQYLAQNYNTIQSSQLYPKGSFSSGVKATPSPPLKSLSLSGSSSSSGSSSAYLSNNYASASASVPSFQSFKSIPLKSYSL